jgi:peroxiredoxin
MEAVGCAGPGGPAWVAHIEQVAEVICMPACESLVGMELPAFGRRHCTGPTDLSDILGSNPPVLLFLPDVASPACRAYIRSFGARREEFDYLGGVIVVITTSPKSVVPAGIPFPVAADAHDLFRDHGLLGGDNSPRAGVIVADRYGTVHSVYWGAACSDLPEARRVARALLGAESLCPECGVPEEHWIEATR